MKRSFLFLVLILLGYSTSAPGQCDPGNGLGGTGADVMVGEFPDSISYGSAGGYHAYSLGTTSCNIGTAELNWISNTNQHPVIGGNLYRLKDGRFEHIGMSWLKHGFTALQQNACGCGCISSGTGTRLGLGCSDPYVASLNGSQGSLGPRSEVFNPSEGEFPYPPVLDPPNPDLTWRRLRVATADVDPAQNAGAVYFAEGHYVTPDDHLNGNANNNTTHQQVTFASNASHSLSFVGGTLQRQLPAIEAWQAQDPSVTLTNITTDENGSVSSLMILGHNVTDNGNGTWHYEYALYNMNSTRGAGAFRLPIAAGVNVTNIGFHAPEYHSGETIQNNPWNAVVGACDLSWSVAPQANPATENALFWGSLYNFRFDADVAPTTGSVTIDYYRPGAVDSIDVTAQIPNGTFASSVQNLSCTTVGQDVQLTWSNPASYSAIEIHKDGVLVATKAGTDTTHTDLGAGVGTHSYDVTGIQAGQCSFAVNCSATVLTPLLISYPTPVPSVLNPLGQTVDVDVAELNGGVRLAGGQKMFYDAGAGFVEVVMTPQTGSLFAAAFPATPCGQSINYYFSAEDTLGTVILDPADAPASTFTALSAASVSTTLQDFETGNASWTVGAPGDSATTGIWEHGDPIGTSVQPEDDHTDPGALCWFTGQHPGGGSGANDLDNGATTLITSAFDLSTMVNPTLGYWRWYANNGNGAVDDTFVIDINDGFGWVNVETLGPNDANSVGGWIYHEITVTDFVTLTTNVQLRFVASDFGGGSIVEAAIDDFRIQDVECETDCNNNSIDDAIDISMGTSQDCNSNGTPDECEIAAGAPDVNMNSILDECEGSFFQRGDCNADGNYDVSDPVRHLGILFAGEPFATCEDACDTNDDGLSNIADPVASLTALFASGAAPPAPFGSCGIDPTSDTLTCISFPCP